MYLHISLRHARRERIELLVGRARRLTSESNAVHHVTVVHAQILRGTLARHSSSIRSDLIAGCGQGFNEAVCSLRCRSIVKLTALEDGEATRTGTHGLALVLALNGDLVKLRSRECRRLLLLDLLWEPCALHLLLLMDLLLN